MNKPNWKTSSYTGSSGGNCIEVAGHDSRVLVRDTKDRQGATLRFTPDAWRRFAKQLKGLASDTLATLSEIIRGGRFVCRKYVRNTFRRTVCTLPLVALDLQHVICVFYGFNLLFPLFEAGR